MPVRSGIVKNNECPCSFKEDLAMPIRYVDAHIHLSDEEYSDKVDEIISEAANFKVTAMVSNSMDYATCINSLQLARKYRGLVFAALGVHPWSVNNLSEDDLQRTSEFILENGRAGEVLAIGEVGLDYKYKDVWDRQLKVFDEMLHLAELLNLPVILHSRGTSEKIVELLPSYNVKMVLLHWFSYPISLISKIVERGYYVSEGPPVVYSSGIQAVVQNMPIENILTETDGPVRYFKPPFNGKLTTPAFLPHVVRAVAAIKKMNEVDAADQIARNFENFFGAAPKG
ncbi:MAG: TatD family hydrolase [Nitrososphaerota archaeon]|nr:TatD family hydrolase [Candidatus Bathyarchaeota archaeon]MDW8193782.1 TatD family hydrolase [Nitrososphaerota archaeon]